MISLNIQERILKYFARLDSMKPSEFDRNFIKEWHYLTVLKDLILKDIEQSIENDGENLDEKIKQSGLLDEDEAKLV